MSGHAILDSCHNCGKAGVQLRIVHLSEDSLDCGHVLDGKYGGNEGGTRYHHIHFIVACDDCKRNIWERSHEANDYQ